MKDESQRVKRQAKNRMKPDNESKTEIQAATRLLFFSTTSVGLSSTRRTSTRSSSSTSRNRSLPSTRTRAGSRLGAGGPRTVECPLQASVKIARRSSKGKSSICTKTEKNEVSFCVGYTGGNEGTGEEGTTHGTEEGMLRVQAFCFEPRRGDSWEVEQRDSVKFV